MITGSFWLLINHKVGYFIRHCLQDDVAGMKRHIHYMLDNYFPHTTLFVKPIINTPSSCECFVSFHHQWCEAPSNLQYKSHLGKENWSLRCSWSFACQRCSNQIFILAWHMTCKGNCNTGQDKCKLWGLERIILAFEGDNLYGCNG